MITVKTGFCEIRRGDNRAAVAEKVELGVKVAYPPDSSARIEQLSQCAYIADAFCKVPKIETGDNLYGSRPEREQATDGLTFDERADNTKPAGVQTQSGLQF